METTMTDTTTGTDNPKPANPFARSIAVKVACGVWGVRRKLDNGDVDVNDATSGDRVNKQAIAISKKIVDCDEYHQIVKADQEIRKYLATQCIHVPFLREGTYLIPIDTFDEAMDRVTQWEKYQRPDLVTRFMDRYRTDLLDTERERLGALFDASQYPSASRVREAFYTDVTFPPLGESGVQVDKRLATLNRAAYDRAVEKAQSSIAEATGQIRDALRVGLAELVSNLQESLRGSYDDGAKKALKQPAINRLTEWLELFASRDLTSDAALAEQVAKCKRVLQGSATDAEALRTDNDLRGSVQRRIAEVTTTLQTLVQRKARRFDDD